MIPDSKRESVEHALQQTFGIRTPEAIELLTGGMSSALVFKILIRGAPYLLRLTMKNDVFSDRARQFACLKIAADAGVTPSVLYSDAQRGLSVTGYIEERPLKDVPLMPHLSGLIRKIHSLPLFPKLVDYLDGVDLILQQFQASRLLPASSTAEYLGYYAQIQQVYPRHEPDLVSSHNDLNPKNLLFDGAKLWAVDWEAAFAADKYVDLAVVANSFVWNDEDESALLTGYFGDKPTAYQSARFFLMRQICQMCYALSFFRLAAAGLPPGVVAPEDMTAPGLQELYLQVRAGEVSLAHCEGQLLYGKVLIGESLRMMKTERFGEALKVVRAGATAGTGQSG